VAFTDNCVSPTCPETNQNPAISCEFKFKGGAECKTQTWQTNGLTPMMAIRNWLKDYMTDKDKGVILFWNSTSQKSQLVILEDPLPKCWADLSKETCSRSIGTYIVNGGERSPVLSFDPQIKFNFAAAAKAGGGVDSQKSDASNAPGQPCPEGQGDAKGNGPTPVGIGDTTFNTQNDNHNNIYGPGNLPLLQRSNAAAERANKTYENIEAELRIQGDPSLDNPFSIKVKTVSLLVVNPFHIGTRNGDTLHKNCPDWLLAAPCNQILSNKSWFIKGVSHEIKEGSYITVLRLYLPAPGQTIIP